MVIAIDGPAAAGKSTVARGVARELDFAYLDSGAMYRAVALLWLEDPERLPAAIARAARIDPRERVTVNGRDVADEIRSERVSKAASQLAADAGVREALVAKQRELIARGDWVVEGRDIATVVAPDAQLKVFLTAQDSERARRRATELGADVATVDEELAQRDSRDRTRAHSPLRPASDAVVLDTTELSPAQAIERIAALARGILGR
ncbi:MAG TPA: (d)CMP kinase [Solirubrobacteraceae bacterium]|jgi:cytidylate kinase|nr:(d)CMP kinase [Solirubrobacteraceae bacterium]